MHEEMVTACREPVAADKGAIAQRFVQIGMTNVEAGNDVVGDFPGEVWWDCLRDDWHLW